MDPENTQSDLALQHIEDEIQNEIQDQTDLTVKEGRAEFEDEEMPVIPSNLSAANKYLGTLVLLVGTPGSGKTTFAKSLLKHFPQKWVRINQDELGSRKDCEQKLLNVIQNAQITSPLNAVNVVIDRTNFDMPQRKPWISIARTYGFSSIESIHFDVPFATCRSRILQRRDHPSNVDGERGVEVLDKFQTLMVPPTLDEGINKILKIEGELVFVEHGEEETMETRHEVETLTPTATMIASMTTMTTIRNDSVYTKESVSDVLNKLASLPRYDISSIPFEKWPWPPRSNNNNQSRGNSYNHQYQRPNYNSYRGYHTQHPRPYAYSPSRGRPYQTQPYRAEPYAPERSYRPQQSYQQQRPQQYRPYSSNTYSSRPNDQYSSGGRGRGGGQRGRGGHGSHSGNWREQSRGRPAY